MLTANFSESEVTASEKAKALEIDNELPEELKGAVLYTAQKLEQVRHVLGDYPLHINSWYRCPELNKAVGSKPTSQHLRGEAVDFVCVYAGTPLDICKKLLNNQASIQWDQLILEHTWVHISFQPNPNIKPRGHVLSLLANGSYAQGLTNKNGTPYD